MNWEAMANGAFAQPGDLSGGDTAREFGDVVSGRYWMPDPRTGKGVLRSRVTTFCERLEDSYAITAWEKRVTLHGLTLREDLYLKACGTELSDSKGMDSVLRDAKEAGGGSVGANKGTGLHGLFNAADAAGVDEAYRRCPTKYRPVLEAYVRALRDNHLKVNPDVTERLVFIEELGLCGRMDGAVREAARTDDTVIDYKSQKKWYGWGKVSLQLSCYSRATVGWDPYECLYVDLPKLRQDSALVFWCPVMPEERIGEIEVIEVDIETAWKEAAPLAVALREWQNKGKRKGALSRPYSRPLSPVEAYARSLRDAGSTEDLLTVHREADARGVWGEELRQVAEATYLRLTSH